MYDTYRTVVYWLGIERWIWRVASRGWVRGFGVGMLGWERRDAAGWWLVVGMNGWKDGWRKGRMNGRMEKSADGVDRPTR